MQNDLISRTSLIEAMDKVRFQVNVSEENGKTRPFIDYANILRCIEEQPTAYDVEKVVAEWKYSPKEDIATCKSCSYEHYLGTYHQYATNFCPNCGAKMNGGKE